MLVFQNLPEEDVLERVQFGKHVSFFKLKEWMMILLFGIITTVAVISSYTYLLNSTKEIAQARGFAIALLGLLSATITIALSRGKTLMARLVFIYTLALTFVAVQVPLFMQLFDVTPLSAVDWLVLLMMATVFGMFIVASAKRRDA